MSQQDLEKNASNKLYRITKEINTKYLLFNDEQLSEAKQEIFDANLTASESKELIEKITALDKLKLKPSEFKLQYLQILDDNTKILSAFNARRKLKLDAVTELYEIVEKLNAKHFFYTRIEGLKQELIDADLDVSEIKNLIKKIDALDKLQLETSEFNKQIDRLLSSNPKIARVFVDSRLANTEEELWYMTLVAGIAIVELYTFSIASTIASTYREAFLLDEIGEYYHVGVDRGIHKVYAKEDEEKRFEIDEERNRIDANQDEHARFAIDDENIRKELDKHHEE